MGQLTWNDRDVLGSTYVSGSKLTMGGTVNIASGATLTGSADAILNTGVLKGGPGSFFAMNGSLEWGSMDIEGFGATGFDTGGTLTISGGDRKLTDTVIRRYADTTWTGGNIEMKDASIQNFALFEIDGTGLELKKTGDEASLFNSQAGNGTVATIRLNGAEVTIGADVQNESSLDLNGKKLTLQGNFFQTMYGSVQFEGGTLQMDNTAKTLTLDGGFMEGDGTLIGDLVLAGATLRIRNRNQFKIDGNFSMSASSTIHVIAYYEFGRIELLGANRTASVLTDRMTFAALYPPTEWKDFIVGGTVTASSVEPFHPDFDWRIVAGVFQLRSLPW